jgi:hypothetical protein
MAFKFRSRSCVHLLRNLVFLLGTVALAVDSAISAPRFPSRRHRIRKHPPSSNPFERWPVAVAPSQAHAVRPIAAEQPSSGPEETRQSGERRSCAQATQEGVYVGRGQAGTTGPGAEPSPQALPSASSRPPPPPPGPVPLPPPACAGTTRIPRARRDFGITASNR